MIRCTVDAALTIDCRVLEGGDHYPRYYLYRYRSGDRCEESGNRSGHYRSDRILDNHDDSPLDYVSAVFGQGKKE